MVVIKFTLDVAAFNWVQIVVRIPVVSCGNGWLGHINWVRMCCGWGYDAVVLDQLEEVQLVRACLLLRLLLLQAELTRYQNVTLMVSKVDPDLLRSPPNLPPRIPAGHCCVALVSF